MIYRILLVLVVITIFGNIVAVEISRYFPIFFDLSKYLGIYLGVNFGLLIFILFSWAAFRIQKSRYPKNFTAPKDDSQIKEEIKQYGGLAFIKEVFNKNKNLLVEYKPELKPQDARNTIKAFGILFASVAILLVLIVSVYLFFVNMQVKNKNGYEKFSILINKITNTPFYKLINKFGTNYYNRRYHRY